MIRGDISEVLRELDEKVISIGWTEHNNGFIIHLEDDTRSDEELEDLRFNVSAKLTEMSGYAYPEFLGCSGTFAIFFCFNGAYDVNNNKLYLRLLNRLIIIDNINEDLAIATLEKFGCPYKIIE